MIKSTAETLFEKGFEQGFAEKGLPFNDPPPPNPKNNNPQESIPSSKMDGSS